MTVLLGQTIGPDLLIEHAYPMIFPWDFTSLATTEFLSPTIRDRGSAFVRSEKMGRLEPHCVSLKTNPKKPGSLVSARDCVQVCAAQMHAHANGASLKLAH